jgi:hypothetical protein
MLKKTFSLLVFTKYFLYNFFSSLFKIFSSKLSFVQNPFTDFYFFQKIFLFFIFMCNFLLSLFEKFSLKTFSLYLSSKFSCINFFV